MADDKYNYQGSSGSGSGSGSDRDRDHSGGQRGRSRLRGNVQGGRHNPSMTPQRSSYSRALAAGGRRSAPPQDVSWPQSPISSREVDMADDKYNYQGSPGSGSGSGSDRDRDHSGGQRGRSRLRGNVPGGRHNPSMPPQRSSYSRALAAGGRRSAPPQDVSWPQSPISSREVDMADDKYNYQGSPGSGSGSGSDRDRDHSGGQRGRSRLRGNVPGGRHNPSMPPQRSSYSRALAAGGRRSAPPQDVSWPQSPISSREVGSSSAPFRPDQKGKDYDESVRFLANHFKINFDSAATIIEYEPDIEVKKKLPEVNLPLKTRDKSKKRSLIEKLFQDNVFAYDGKYIFSAIPRVPGEVTIKVHGREGTSARTFIINIKEKRLELKELDDYLSERNPAINFRPVLRGMDVVMRENPARHLMQVGRNFYRKHPTGNSDLAYGTKAHTGFKQSLKPTLNGLALCLDYSAAAFYEKIPIIDFLRKNVKDFRIEDVNRLRPTVEKELRGLKVEETLSQAKRKYTISGLSAIATRDLSFQKEKEQKTKVVDYIRGKYTMEIRYLDIPCLNLGSTKHPIYMPIEFCKLAEGQPCLKDGLKLGIVTPWVRMNAILEDVHETHVSSSDCAVIGELKIEVVNNTMTEVVGRVIHPPKLKLLSSKSSKPLEILIDAEERHWNYNGKIFVEGVNVKTWALINFATFDHKDEKDSKTKEFIGNLKERSTKLGMVMEYPVICQNNYDMNVFSSADRIRNVLQVVVEGQRDLQIIICLISDKNDAGYSRLKWITETEMGVMTQCCRFDNYGSCKNKNTYMDNLCMKINQKVGGRNMELQESLLAFQDETSVMLIGADVNHPAANDKTSKSIAAIVGTVNWPAANQYIARIEIQSKRKEQIEKFGEMCKDLIDTFSEFNDEKRKPDRIVVFRDGVGEGQFEAVQEELKGLKSAISVDDYNPKVTVVVAQKRHHTRLFRERVIDCDRRDISNVLPGTVVDTDIVDPSMLNFYLCSHKAIFGTSKPTHYHILHDENEFTSNELQNFIYHLCFTFARCTKPVSLVPPILYADRAAYRGRMFYEASRETKIADDHRCKLHERVKNKMFFL